MSKGLKIARENSPVFENLLVLMLPANIEGLNKRSIRNAIENLMLDTSDHIVNIEIKRKINRAFRSRRRKMDNWCRAKCEWIKGCFLKCLCSSNKSMKIKKFKPPVIKSRKYKILD